MDLFTGFLRIYCVDVDEHDQLIKHLLSLDASYVELDGTSVGCSADLRNEVMEIAHPDPVVPDSDIDWKGFVDSLSRTLVELAYPRVAVIWNNADEVASTRLSRLIKACIVFHSAAQRVTVVSEDNSIPVQLILILLGRGHGFKRLSQISRPQR